jgi:hypothetical protein
MLTLTNGDAASFVLQVSGPRAYTATIASGAFSVVGFVVPGVYTLTTSSGAAATVTVTPGSYSSAEGLNQNGQMYRFAVTRQVGGTGDAIARQLRFVDWAGNTTMVALPTLLLPSTATGTPFCFGDGSGTACPCGNASAVGAQEGCLNSLATAGRLRGTGVASLAADTFVLQGTGMANSSAIVKVGAGNAELLTPSMVFHRDAFAFATADLVMPKGVDFAAREVYDGISLRTVRQYAISTDTMPCRIDVLYGYKTIRAQLAARIHADG